MRLRELTKFQRALLEILPVAPGGESLDALAEELLGRRAPADRGRIRRGLDALAAALGGIHVGRGTDALERPGVVLYGLRRADLPRVRRFFAPSKAGQGRDSTRRKHRASSSVVRGSTRSSPPLAAAP